MPESVGRQTYSIPSLNSPSPPGPPRTTRMSVLIAPGVPHHPPPLAPSVIMASRSRRPSPLKSAGTTLTTSCGNAMLDAWVYLKLSARSATKGLRDGKDERRVLNSHPSSLPKVATPTHHVARDTGGQSCHLGPTQTSQSCTTRQHMHWSLQTLPLPLTFGRR